MKTTNEIQEQTWRNEFGASKDLQAEFRLGGVEAYVTLKKREAGEVDKFADATIETFQAARPDLYEQIFTAGRTAELARFVELQNACGDDSELLAQSFVEGRASEAALRQRTHRLESENRKLQAEPLLLRRQFADSPELQAEFRLGGVEAYVAMRQRELENEQAAVDREFKSQQKETSFRNLAVETAG